MLILFFRLNLGHFPKHSWREQYYLSSKALPSNWGAPEFNDGTSCLLQRFPILTPGLLSSALSCQLTKCDKHSAQFANNHPLPMERTPLKNFSE